MSTTDDGFSEQELKRAMRASLKPQSHKHKPQISSETDFEESQPKKKTKVSKEPSKRKEKKNGDANDVMKIDRKSKSENKDGQKDSDTLTRRTDIDVPPIIAQANSMDGIHNRQKARNAIRIDSDDDDDLAFEEIPVINKKSSQPKPSQQKSTFSSTADKKDTQIHSHSGDIKDNKRKKQPVITPPAPDSCHDNAAAKKTKSLKRGRSVADAVSELDIISQQHQNSPNVIDEPAQPLPNAKPAKATPTEYNETADIISQGVKVKSNKIERDKEDSEEPNHFGSDDIMDSDDKASPKKPKITKEKKSKATKNGAKPKEAKAPSAAKPASDCQRASKVTTSMDAPPQDRRKVVLQVKPPNADNIDAHKTPHKTPSASNSSELPTTKTTFMLTPGVKRSGLSKRYYRRSLRLNVY